MIIFVHKYRILLHRIFQLRYPRLPVVLAARALRASAEDIRSVSILLDEATVDGKATRSARPGA